jgi:hypothetical protein
MPGADESFPEGYVGLNVAAGTEGEESEVHVTIVSQSAGGDKPAL